MWAPFVKKVFSFGLVGLVGAACDYGSRYLLLGVGAPALLARAASYIIGSTVAYFLNSYYTFDGNRSRGEKARATLSYIFCFVCAVAVDAVVRHVLGGVEHVLVISWIVSQAAATLLNFTLQAVWVFQPEETGEAGGNADSAVPADPAGPTDPANQA